MPLFGGPPDVYNLKAKGNVTGLIKALGYQRDSTVRQAAALALGEIGDTRAVEPLIVALNDEDSWVRQAAAGALGRIRDTRAVEPLIAALKDADEYVREATAEALGNVGNAQAVKPLIAALRDADDDVRAAAAGALGSIGDARAVKPLIAALKHEYIRDAAAGALGSIGDARAVKPLIATLKHADDAARRGAFKSLKNLGEYFCNRCEKELRGQDLKLARKRDEDKEAFISDVYSPGVPTQIRKVWELSAETFYCGECLSGSKGWEEKNKVCMNCSHFMMNFVRLPNVADFYCREKTLEVIYDPLKHTCSKWELAEMFVSE